MAIIEFDNARFAYRSGAQALDGLNLKVEAGEFACILGGNGSGKSTLAKHVNALLTPDSGTVRVLGRDTRDNAETFTVRSSVGMVFQNPDDQIIASIVEDDVAFGPGNLGVPPEELRRRVARALEQVGLAGFGKRETAALSGGQKQLVAIAGALAMEPQILVLDEATSMLDPRGRAGVMRICRDLNEAGITVVLITHFAEEARQASRVIVLDRGKVALDGTPNHVFSQAGRLEELSLEPPDATRTLPARAPQPLPDDAPTAIGFENVTYEYRDWALRDVTLAIRRGEVFGIAGHTGSGKSTLIQLAGNLLKPTSGSVTAADRHEVGVVFQYPEHQLFAATVFDDVAFGPRNLGLASGVVESRVRESLELVHLALDELRDTSPFELSGGLQRRIAIAGVLAMHPSVLIFDEPCAGLDPRARRAFLALVEELHASGLTIVMVSHDMDDLALLCSRIAVLNEGRLEQVGSPAEVFADREHLREIGLAATCPPPDDPTVTRNRTGPSRLP